MIKFEVNQQSGAKIAPATWRRWAKKIERVIAVHRAEVSVAIVGTAAIKRLNRDYRRLDRVTDVLSFGRPAKSLKPDFAPTSYLGEIIICLPRATQQAQAAKHSLNREIELLLVHGFLHLIGYDHEKSARQAKIMSALEEKIAKTK